MHALRTPGALALDLSLGELGVEPLEGRELSRIDGGAYFAAGCMIGLSVGGIFVACAILAAGYYIYTHT